jgi:hypothetical protein
MTLINCHYKQVLGMLIRKQSVDKFGLILSVRVLASEFLHCVDTIILAIRT